MFSPSRMPLGVVIFFVVSLGFVVWLGGLFDLGDFSRLEAECFVESYEHEWCAFVGFFSSG